MAAQTLLECIRQGNYTREAMNVYQQRWMYAFGSDFKCQATQRIAQRTHTLDHAYR